MFLILIAECPYFWAPSSVCSWYTCVNLDIFFLLMLVCCSICLSLQLANMHQPTWVVDHPRSQNICAKITVYDSYTEMISKQEIHNEWCYSEVLLNITVLSIVLYHTKQRRLTCSVGINCYPNELSEPFAVGDNDSGGYNSFRYMLTMIQIIIGIIRTGNFWAENGLYLPPPHMMELEP